MYTVLFTCIIAWEFFTSFSCKRFVLPNTFSWTWTICSFHCAISLNLSSLWQCRLSSEREQWKSTTMQGQSLWSLFTLEEKLSVACNSLLLAQEAYEMLVYHYIIWKVPRNEKTYIQFSIMSNFDEFISKVLYEKRVQCIKSHSGIWCALVILMSQIPRIKIKMFLSFIKWTG